jgi:hypothetical protein
MTYNIGLCQTNKYDPQLAKKAELGIIVNPYDVIDRIKTGQYNFFYPRFE